MDEEIQKLNRFIQDCYTVRRGLLTAASNYRDLRARCDEAYMNKDIELHPELLKQIQELDNESMRLPAVILDEMLHIAELYYHNFYLVNSRDGVEPMSF